MTGCAVKGCKNRSEKPNKDKSISFHGIPSDPVNALNWIEYVRQSRKDKNWNPSKNTKLCSAHFQNKFKYVTNKGLSRLREEAVPLKADLVEDSEQDNVEKARTIAVTRIQRKSSDISIASINEDQKTPKITYEVDNTCSDVKSNGPIWTEVDTDQVELASNIKFNTAIELGIDSLLGNAVESKIRLTLRKKDAVQKRQRKVLKTLQQQVSRLKNSNANLKQVIKKYKMNRNVKNVSKLKELSCTLYGDVASPPVRFVMITASLLGTKLKFQNIDLFKSENMTDSFRLINPLQKVPALVVGDEAICDSHAIALYLCQKSHNQELYPKDDALMKARVDEMLFFNSSTLFPVDSAIFTKFFAGQWPPSEHDIAKWYSALDHLEHRLIQSEWLSGDMMLLSDICCSMTVSSLDVLMSIPDRHVKVREWLKRLNELPSYKINEEGIDRLRFHIESIGPK